MDHSLTMFFVLCFLLTITPGADTALVLSNALRTGSKGVLMTTLGICAGLLFHAAMSALGLSVILQQSARLYSAIKWAGALYLMYLGAKSVYGAFGSAAATAPADAPRNGSAFRQGILTNILNPKVAVFYLTFLPQFVDPARSVLFQSFALASIHISMSFVWLYAIGSFVGYFRAFLSRPRVRRSMESVTGLALFGFGARLALSRD
jgi:RhtB (resistance to homoserine/threonine) family protein